ncbi:MAG: hypothetical protein RMK49_06395 [Abditibacteriales bacterium]|nr:hypothetical protein [Abditibacteriales bacterium]
MASGAKPSPCLSWRVERSEAIPLPVMASEAKPSSCLSWRAERSHPPACHGERSEAILLPVMASEAKPSPAEELVAAKGMTSPHSP